MFDLHQFHNFEHIFFIFTKCEGVAAEDVVAIEGVVDVGESFLFDRSRTETVNPRTPALTPVARNQNLKEQRYAKY